MNDQRHTYHEPARDIPVLAQCDVLVCGGGPAGCAAALAAARHGARTLLAERDGYLGGATVNQFVCAVLSMNGADLQGVWHEWMNALQRLGGVGELASRRGRYVDGSVDPELVKHAWDGLLAQAGVTLLHHALAAGAIVEEGQARGVLVETKAGRQAILARRVIDCTGDGIVCAQAGVPWEQGDGETPYAQACTKVLRLGDARKPEGFPTAEDLARLDADFKAASERHEFTTPVITSGRILNYIRSWNRPLANRPEMLVVGPQRVLKVDPLDPWDLTRAEREGREQCRQVAGYHIKYLPGCQDAYLLDTSSHIGVRATRRVQGIARVTRDDVLGFRKHPDGIARASWIVDLWPHDSYTAPAVRYDDPAWMKRLKEGDYYDIRYGALVAQGVDNLLVAGRCISADYWAQGSLRIQQTCMATGQAAGTAAALSLSRNVTPRELDPLLVVARLAEDRAAVESEMNFLRGLALAPLGSQ